MDLTVVLLFVAGLVFLVAGAEVLVKGASRLAAGWGISPLVIGLTVVAYGTSAPELAVSIKSAWAGQADLALGNVVGSNVFNVLFILGLSALVSPLVVSSQLVRIDVPLMVLASVITLLFAADGMIGRVDAAILFAGAIAYTVFQVRQSRRESAAIQQEYAEEFAPKKASSPLANLALVGAGLALLVLGSRWLVDAAIVFARAMGVSELVIGLTIVAAGTSLPEVATSILATWRGERDIAVGNVVGSNIFNLLTVLGLAGVVSPAGLAVPPSFLAFDGLVMLAVAVACLPIFASGARIDRWEGGLFLLYYVAYTTYLLLQAQQHDVLPKFSAVMELFVLPLTALTLAVVGWRTWRARHPA